MNTYKFYTRKTIGLLVILLLLGLFYLLNNFIYQEKQADGVMVEPYRTSLSGDYVCLPYENAPAQPVEGCVFGIRTDTGEYYGIDFFLMSQTHDPVSVGERISANGVVQIAENLDAGLWKKYPIEGVFLVTDSLAVSQQNTPNQGTVSLGQSVTIMGFVISPQKIVSDSRCPVSVQCVWAGTVEVQTTLSTQVAHGEHVLRLGEPQMFGDYEVALIDVSPAKNQGAFIGSDYKLTYKITR